MSELKTSKYQAYPEYKNFNIEWSDRLPENWNTVNLRWVSAIYAGGTPSKTNIGYWENGTIPWINSGAVNQGLVIQPSTLITQEAFENSSAKWIPLGSLVVALAGQGKTKGMVAQLGLATTCNQSMAAIVPDKKYYSRYLYWWLTSNYQNIRNMSGGDLRDGLNLEHLGNIQCPQPNETECIAISHFLDHETAKIDTLIDKQQQLIKLLKEKRQAVISHAVTKGLNAQAPMKDSGVEWLGEVPEHWNIAPLKYLVNEKAAGPYGASLTKAMYTTSGIKVYGQQQVISNNFSVGDYYISEEKYKEMTRYTVFSDDVLISVMGTVGKVSVVPEEAELGIINPRLVRYKFDSEKILPHFVQALIMSQSYQNRLSEASQGSTMEGLNMGILGDLPLVFPSVDEQEKVLLLIKKETLKYSSGIAKAEESVALSIERRTALISAAVTGKIDVRHWEQPHD